jgi:hypothetical protein
MRRMRLGLHLWRRMIEFLFVLLCVVVFLFETFDLYFAMLKLFDLYYSAYPGPFETISGSNFYSSCVLLLLGFTLCPFVTKREINFYFWTGNVFPKPVK